MKTILFIIVALPLSSVFITSIQADTFPHEQLTYFLINSISIHDKPFTQGFELHDGIFYGSSGLYNQSYLFKQTKIAPSHRTKKKLPKDVFAEGITILNNTGYALTWKNQTGYIFDPDSLNVTSSFAYNGEGWGLTNDGQSLIMSNGSNQLIWLSPKDFSSIKKLSVYRQSIPVNYINELEWAEDKILANIWLSNEIVIINPDNGQVMASVDLSEIVQHEKNKNKHSDVLNGIAYDKQTNSYWITGKNWSSAYQIKLVSKKMAR